MKYAVIGTGAIGGFYGAKLARSGQEVHFLLHSDYADVARDGLTVRSCDGDFRLPTVNAYGDVRDMPKCDVVIVGLKTTRESLLREMLPCVMAEGGLALLIQNGIGVEECVQLMCPGVQLAAGLAFICSTKRGPGLIDHQHYGHINIANFSCRDKALLEAVIADFVGAGIKAREVEYAEARWKKALWNMPFNGLTVALDAQTDELMRDEASMRLLREMMEEVVMAARALGVSQMGDDAVDKNIELTQKMTPYSPSMKVDYDSGRPMEIEFLYSRPIAMAAAKGVMMPRLSMLEAQLRFLEARRQKGRESK